MSADEPLPRRLAGTGLDLLRRLPIGWICLLCLGLRLAYLWLAAAQASRSNYWQAAENLWGDGTRPPSTFLEPLYPLFLAVARWLLGDQLPLILALQAALSTVGCYALYRLALVLGAKREAAALAALLYAAHPYLIRQSVALIYLPLLIPLLILAVRHYLEIPRRRAAPLFGLTAGLALATRADFAAVYLLLVGWLIVNRLSKPAVTALAATALVAGPAVARQIVIDGSVLPTRGGFDLLKGNCQYSDRLLPDYSLDLLNDWIFETLLREAPELERANSREKDRFFRQKAWEFIREHPWRTLRLKVLNVAYLYSPMLVPTHPVGPDTGLEIEPADMRVTGVPPRSIWPVAGHVLFSGMILVGAAGGIFLRRKRLGDVPLWLVVGGYTVVYSIFWPATRLRASFEFVLIFYAGFFFWWVLARSSRELS